MEETMKRKMVVHNTSVYLGGPNIVCDKCRHTRINEPYIHKMYRRGGGKERYENICWRCCRDAESTLLIWQKWPLAFELVRGCESWRLEWAPDVKALIVGHLEIKNNT